MRFPFLKYSLIVACLLFINCKNNTAKQEVEIMNAPVKNDADITEKNDNPTLQDSTLSQALLEGKQVYEQNCVVCHQSSGGGVPNMNPPLNGTDYVLGDKERLISIVLKGSSAGLKINGVSYSNNMPAFADNLDDAQIANVLTYIRNSFGNEASQVSEEDVSSVRGSIKK